MRLFASVCNCVRLCFVRELKMLIREYGNTGGIKKEEVKLRKRGAWYAKSRDGDGEISGRLKRKRKACVISLVLLFLSVLLL